MPLTAIGPAASTPTATRSSPMGNRSCLRRPARTAVMTPSNTTNPAPTAAAITKAPVAVSTVKASLAVWVSGVW